jgi:hypothetical protein
MASQKCDHCGAPRQTSAPACLYCKTLFAEPAPPGAPAALAAGLPQAVAREISEELATGNKIGAIRAYRVGMQRDTGQKIGLAEAKAFIERLAQGNG